MEIKYLKELELNPTLRNWTIKPIPESEISELEQLYNDGKEFPFALRELLFLAGSYCYVLEYGIFKTQQEMQESVRNDLKRRDKRINEPFFAIDVYGGSQCLFVYLNNSDDPAVYEAVYWEEEEWFYCICPNLSTYISNLIERVKQGRNPF